MSEKLEVYSIFRSIQGESTNAGRPCVFVRLSGCPLDCSYCDTGYAKTGSSTSMSVDEILAKVIALRARLVEVTGGEPLAQAASLPLLTALANAGLEVCLETSGAFPIAEVDDRVRVIMDVKTPGSKMAGELVRRNLELVGVRPMELKFVVVDRADFEWSAAFIEEAGLEGRCEILFSAAFHRVTLDELAGWVLSSGLEARVQPQLHRLIWPKGEQER